MVGTLHDQNHLPTSVQIMQLNGFIFIKTPLGNIDFFNINPNKIYCNLEVFNTEGVKTEINNEAADYVYPHTKIQASANLKNIISFQMWKYVL